MSIFLCMPNQRDSFKYSATQSKTISLKKMALGIYYDRHTHTYTHTHKYARIKSKIKNKKCSICTIKDWCTDVVGCA